MKKIEHKRAFSEIPIQDILVQSISCKEAPKFSDSLQQKRSVFNHKHKKKKPPAQFLTTNRHIRSSSEGNLKLKSLINLEGKEVAKAPKIFPNQIFTDCYDKEGNHDRIMDISESIEVYDVQIPRKSNIVFNWKHLEKNVLKTQEVRPPENSACSRTESTKRIEYDFLQRLNGYPYDETSGTMPEKSGDIYDIIRPLSLERNTSKRNQKRFF
ncbi:unnamed protein product [Blepharisma stoltei]|uniref:Uncharacterized protein n=1 Tax=Blepharisma stoltei TaxID=1481888 RepID=A0AAU9K3X2_9CILI|nr:unnamed protein product [Blepharisma stoltei]